MSEIPSNPFAGLPENLVPNPPAAMPEPPGVVDAMIGASPFKEPLDLDQIFKNLVLDRPLKLFIPPEILAKYKGYEFRFINNIPQEFAAAQRKGFNKVDDPDLVALVADQIAGTDKVGQSFGVTLFARPVAVGQHIAKRNRQQLAAIYAGMDPANKSFDSSKYAENAGPAGGTKASFQGPAFNIRVR